MRARKKDKGEDRSIPLLTVALLVAIVATLAIFFIVDRQKEFQQQYLLMGAEQQVLGQKIAKFSLEALRGNEPSFQQLLVARNQFSTLIDELKNGNPEQGLPPSPEQALGILRKVENSWLELRSYADEILRNRETILSIGEFIGVISELIPQLQETSDEVVRLLVLSLIHI